MRPKALHTTLPNTWLGKQQWHIIYFISCNDFFFSPYFILFIHFLFFKGFLPNPDQRLDSVHRCNSNILQRWWWWGGEQVGIEFPRIFLEISYFRGKFTFAEIIPHQNLREHFQSENHYILWEKQWPVKFLSYLKGANWVWILPWAHVGIWIYRILLHRSIECLLGPVTKSPLSGGPIHWTLILL